MDKRVIGVIHSSDRQLGNVPQVSQSFSYEGGTILSGENLESMWNKNATVTSKGKFPIKKLLDSKGLGMLQVKIICYKLKNISQSMVGTSRSSFS